MIRKKSNLLSPLLAIVTVMWANTASAHVKINGIAYRCTGGITGDGITGSVH